MHKPRAEFASWLSDTNDITKMFLAASQIPDMINMAGGLPESSVYPVRDLALIAEKAISHHPGDTLDYSPIEGLPKLRERIATRFSTEHLTLTQDHILITTGGMQGLDLIGKVLLNEGDRIACQSPAYLGALDAWRPRRPHYHPFFPEQENFDATRSLENAKFAYTVPNFSNPTGRLIAKQTRQALLSAAKETGCWLVEDDPYGALYYDSEPLPRIFSLCGTECSTSYAGPVIYLGTLSKELAPGLRLGWVIAAPEMIAALTTAKQGSDMCTSGISQRIALDALNQNLDQKILPEILNTYRERRDHLCQAMEQHLSDWFDWEVPVGGMFVWATAKRPDFNTDHLLEFAMKAKVCLSPSSVFDPRGQYRQAIRLNFTRNPNDRLVEGVRRIATACRAMHQEAD